MGGPKETLLYGHPTRDGDNFKDKMGQSMTCPNMSGSRYTQIDSTGGKTGTVWTPIGVY